MALLLRTLHKGGNNPVLCLINLSDHHVELEKGVVLACAEEVCPKVEPFGIQKVEIAEQGVQGEREREIDLSPCGCPHNIIPYQSLTQLGPTLMTELGGTLHPLTRDTPAGPFQVVLGTHRFSVNIYVAPIEGEILLGLDFLEANGVSLHLKEKKLQIAGGVMDRFIKQSTGLLPPLCNVRGIKISPLVAVLTI
jgi:hypothetical protein